MHVCWYLEASCQKVVFRANRRKNNPDFVGLNDEIYKAALGLCDILFLFRMNVWIVKCNKGLNFLRLGGWSPILAQRSLLQKTSGVLYGLGVWNQSDRLVEYNGF